MSIILSPRVSAIFADFAYRIQGYKSQDYHLFNRLIPPELNESFHFDKNMGIYGTTGGHIFKKTTGMVVVAEGKSTLYKNHLVIAFRGTNPKLINDVISDLYVSRGVSDSNKTVHGGFLKCFNSMKTELLKIVRQRQPRCIHIIGHSLGGGLANLCADYLQSRFGHEINLYTFAAPRVGVKAFADAMNISPIAIHRLAHSQDPVTIVPIWPFVHAGPEYLFAGSHYDLLSVAAHDIKKYINLASTKNSYQAMALGNTQLVNHKDVVLHYDERFHIKCDKASELLINAAIHTLLKGTGFAGYAGMQAGTMAITTMYDLIAKHMADIATVAKERAEQVKGILGSILVFVGRSGEAVKEISYAVVRRIFGYMLDKLRQLAKMALDRSL